MRWIAILLAVCVMGATTQPATQPSIVEIAQQKVAEREQSLSAAKAHYATAVAACSERAKGTDEYKLMAADAERLKVALDAARATGTPQQKIDASSAYGTVVAKMKAMEEKAAREDGDVSTAAGEIASAKNELDGAREDADAVKKKLAADRIAAEKARVDSDPILSAMRDKKLVIGMTLEQANKAMGVKGHKKMENAEGDSTYEWERTSSYEGVRPGFSGVDTHLTRPPMMVVTKHHTYIADFENGKIVELRDGDQWQTSH